MAKSIHIFHKTAPVHTPVDHPFKAGDFITGVIGYDKEYFTIVSINPVTQHGHAYPFAKLLCHESGEVWGLFLSPNTVSILARREVSNDSF